MQSELFSGAAEKRRTQLQVPRSVWQLHVEYLLATAAEIQTDRRHAATVVREGSASEAQQGGKGIHIGRRADRQMEAKHTAEDSVRLHRRVARLLFATVCTPHEQYQKSANRVNRRGQSRTDAGRCAQHA